MVDATRTVLLHGAAPESFRVLMVTSALQGEGKTFVSSHLAGSLARAGLRTLLVDGDLRNPALHRLFGLGQAPGLSELLRGEAAIADTIQPGLVDGLSILPAGRWDSMAVRALAQGRLTAILQMVRENYDMVVIDSAPVLPVADTLLIGRHVDGVLFSVLRDVSRLPAVHAAYARMAQLQLPILGAVMGGTGRDAYGPYSYGAAEPTEPPLA